MNRWKRSVMRLLSAAFILLCIPLARAQEDQLRLLVQTSALAADDQNRILSSVQIIQEAPVYLLKYDDTSQLEQALEYYAGCPVTVDETVSEAEIPQRNSVYTQTDNPLSYLNTLLAESPPDVNTVRIGTLIENSEQLDLTGSAARQGSGDTLSIQIFDSSMETDVSLIAAAMLYAMYRNPQSVILSVSQAVIQENAFLNMLAEKMMTEGISISYADATEGIEIRSFEAQLTDGASFNEDSGIYEWKPDTSAAGHRFTCRISFSLGGIGDLKAQSMIISLPLHILSNRDGNLSDSYEISVPFENEAGENDLFGYRETENGIEIVNLQEISAGEEGYFEISYLTAEETFAYADGSYTDAILAEIDIQSGENEVTAAAQVSPIRIDTSAAILSVQKRYPEKSSVWNDLWMEQPQIDADEEFLIWEIRSTFADNITQPYTFVLEDEIFSQQTDTRVLGYRFQGESTFTAENRITGQTSDQLRIDYVLTAHKICSEEELVIDNRITATVVPADGIDEPVSVSSSARYTENRNGFHEPEGSFGSEKYAGYTYYGLEELQEKKITQYEGLQYHLIMEGYPYQWSREEDSDPLDPDSYGINSVRYVMHDDAVFLNGSENQLEETDYSFESLLFDIDIQDAVYDETIQNFSACDPVYSPYDELAVEGKYNGEWQRVAVYSLFTESWTCNEALCTAADNRLDFITDCSGFRIQCENAHYHTAVSVTASLRLYGTDHVTELIQDQDRAVITNTEQFTADQNSTELASISRSASDFIRRTYRDSELKKRVISTANDISAKVYTITWKLSMRELITSRLYEKVPYVQNGGTFYDLLPAGCTCDPSSIWMENQEGRLPKSSYDVQMTENYRGSGRTMLVISTSVPGDWYSVIYETMHSWESIRDYGKTVLNPAAYETANSDIADGYPDNGGELSEINRSYFIGLDSSSYGNRFIYTEQPHDISAVTAAVSGLNKKTKGNSSSYTYSDKVRQDQLYSYRLRYETSADSQADHMILFDSLENYSSSQLTSGWHGTLESVDLSQLIQKGIEPVVYISTIENLDIEQHHDLNDTSIWTSSFTDISTAKAVAIDLSMMADGTDFVLEPMQSVTAVLYMRAPSAGEVEDQNFAAYNNVWIQNRLSSAAQDGEEYLIHQDYTELFFRVQNDLCVHKADATDPDIPIAGITFSLSGVSDYGSNIYLSVTSDENGNLLFPSLEKGTYELQETDAGEDYLNDETIHTVTIGPDGSVYANGSDCTETSFLILNERRIHTDLTFEKRDLISQAKPVADAVFRLYGTSVYGNEIIRYGRSTAAGTVIIEEIEPGTYSLKEAEAPDGYIPDSQIYQATVNNEGIAAIENCTCDEQGRMILYNEPLHSFEIIKHSSYDGTAITGAVFRLKGTADDGTEVFVSETSGSRGITKFTGLHAGTYILQEISAPDGYRIDDTVRAVHIDALGNVKITGLKKNSDGQYVILNQPLLTGSVRMIKRWIDDSSSQRPVPVIHLCTEKPQTQPSTATIDIDLWMDEDTGLPWIAEAVWFEENTELTKEEALSQTDVIRIDDGETDQIILIWPEEDGWYWWSDADEIQLPEDCSGMFASCTELESLDLSRFRSDYVTDMSAMFSNCFSLTELDLIHFDTANVTDMNHMFHYCRRITLINVLSFNTSNVVDMSVMFGDCSSLQELDLTSFDTSSVLRMDSMFSACSKLTNIYVLDLWSTDAVYSGRDMFKNCRKLPNYNKSNVDVSMAYVGDGGYLTYRAYTQTESNSSVEAGSSAEGGSTEYVSVSDHFITDEMSDSEKAVLRADEEGWWEILDENTWIYTFPVIDGSADYWYYEEDVDGYLSGTTVYNPGLTQNGTGTIVNFRGTITEYGEMIITKDVVNEDESIKFGFTITLTDENNAPLTGMMVCGDTAFENGIAHVRIAGGETLQIGSIPIGWHYLVEEEELAGYTVTAENASGIIGKEKTTVHFTNYKEESSKETVRLRLKKQLSGRYENMDQEEFIFHLFFTGLKPQKEYCISDGTVFFPDHLGNAEITVKLRSDVYVDIEDLPAGSTYQICEEGGDYLSSYQIECETEPANASRTAERRNRFLSTAVETAESDTQVTFTNRYEYAQNITVMKTCTYETDEEFEFTAEFEGLDETDVIECELGSLSPDEEGRITKTFFLKDSESITFKNVPVSVVYRIGEAASEWIAEYQMEDRSNIGQIRKAYGSSAPYEILMTEDETVNQDEDILITFINRPQPVSLSVSKTVRGNAGSRNDSFHFLLKLDSSLTEIQYEKTENGTLVGAGTISLDENGTGEFELKSSQEIRFINLEPGIGYTVEEIQNNDGYECSIQFKEEVLNQSEVSGVLSRNEEQNTICFYNDRDVVLPTGNRIVSGLYSTGLIVLLAAAVLRFTARF